MLLCKLNSIHPVQSYFLLRSQQLYAGRGAAAPRLLPGGEGILYSKSVKSLADLKSDDEAAAAEAAAQGGEYPPPDGCLYEEPYHARLCAQDPARQLAAQE